MKPFANHYDAKPRRQDQQPSLEEQDEILTVCVAFGTLAVVHLGVPLSKQEVQPMDCCSVSSGGLFRSYTVNPHPVSCKRGYVIAGGV